MRDNIARQLEEDAIRFGHPDEFRMDSKRLGDVWLDQLFSDEEREIPVIDMISEEAFSDLIESIAKDIDLMRLYVAVSFSKASDEAERRGIGSYQVHTVMRDGLISLSQTKTKQEILQVADRFKQDMRRIYREGISREYSKDIREAIEIIGFSCGKRMTAADVAEQIGMEPGTLSKKFKKETGQTITDYILSAKMEEARRMQKKGIYTLEEISDALDFPSYAYFSRRYKQYFGVAPSKMRL